MDVFDFRPEWAKKESGQEVAAVNHSLMIKIARELAISYAIMNGETDIDEVREGLVTKGHDLSGRVNWLGSVFRCDLFQPCGFKQAQHVGSHSRIVRKWKLKK